MVRFTRKDRKDAQERVDRTKSNLKKARNSGDPAKIADAKDRAKMSKAVRTIVNRSGPGPDAYRGGPPGPRDV